MRTSARRRSSTAYVRMRRRLILDVQHSSYGKKLPGDKHGQCKLLGKFTQSMAQGSVSRAHVMEFIATLHLRCSAAYLAISGIAIEERRISLFGQFCLKKMATDKSFRSRYLKLRRILLLGLAAFWAGATLC